MSNTEYYSDFWENKSAPEFKEFKAELYQKSTEHFSSVGEIKPFNVESFDHAPSVENEEEKRKKRAGKEKEKQKVRTRLQKILDNVSKTATKVASTVVGVAAVGVGAVVALSPLFSPSAPTPEPISVSLSELDVGGNFMSYELDVSGLQSNADYDIVISSKNQTLSRDEVISGKNEDLVLGLNENEKYTLLVVEKTDTEPFVHYEKDFTTSGDRIIDDEFQATLEIPNADSITVEWGEEKNTVNLNALFSPNADANYKYRVSLTDSDGTVVSSYLGNEGAVRLDVPSEIDGVTVTYQTLYDTGRHEVIYSTSEIDKKLHLKAPELKFSDEKVLIQPGYYGIEYSVSSELAHLESYNDLTVTVNGVDCPSYFDSSSVNKTAVLWVEFVDPVDEFDLEATLLLNGAYGGNARTVTVKKHYVNELEFYDSAYYSATYGTVEFTFVHSEIDGYVLIKNISDGTEEQVTYTSYSYPFTSDCQYSYALYDKENNRLTEEKTVSFSPISKPDYTFTYCNSGEVIYTVNEDNTFNFYFYTMFSCDDPSVYYEITLSDSLRSYRFQSTEKFLKAENLPSSDYALSFRVLRTDELGATYELSNTVPSGTTGAVFSTDISYTLTDDSTVRFDFDNLLSINGDIHLTMNGKSYVFSKDELVPSEYYNTLTVSTDGEKIESFELTYYSYRRHINDHIYSQFADQIKGTPYIKTTITF